MRNYTCPSNATNPASDSTDSADCDETMSGFYIIAVITCVVIGASWIYKRKCKKSQTMQTTHATHAMQELPNIECTSLEKPTDSYIALLSAPAEDDPSDPR